MELLQSPAELMEIGMKHVLGSDGLLKDVPIVGSVFSIASACKDVRSLLFARKIKAFLETPDSKLWEVRKFQDEDLANNERDDELAEILLMALDKVTDLNKPQLFAKAFGTYLDGQLARDTLLMLIHAVDLSFILDLQKFIEQGGSQLNNENLWVNRLAGVGLFNSYSKSSFGSGSIEYELSPLGASLLHVIEHCSAATE